MPQLELETKASGLEKSAAHAFVLLRGYIDPSTVFSLESKLEELRDGDTRDLIVDCSELMYVNSRGMGTIMQFYRDFRDKGRELVLTNVTNVVLQLLEIIGVPAVVPILPDLDAAVAYLASGPVGKRPHPASGPRPKKALSAVKKKDDEPPHPRADSSILLVSPWHNEFNDILRRRLASVAARFEIVENCKAAMEVFDVVNPDLVILEDKAEGSDEFVLALKTEKRKSVSPLIRIYAKEDELKLQGSFKIWENDYLIEPFDITELFTLSEQDLMQSPARRRGILHQSHFTLHSSPQSVDKANRLAASIIDQLGFDAEAASGIKAAYAEAVDNAIRHGNAHRRERRVDVRFLADREKLTIRVEDEGDGFDYEELMKKIAKGKEAYKRGLQKAQERGGRGILLMSLCVDELRYEGKGNVLVLVKNL